MFESLHPLYDRIVIKKQIAPEKKTASGLLLPEAETVLLRATVVRVGEGRRKEDGSLIPLRVKAGDVVIVGKYAVMNSDNEYAVIKEDDVLGIEGNE